MKIIDISQNNLLKQTFSNYLKNRAAVDAMRLTTIMTDSVMFTVFTET